MEFPSGHRAPFLTFRPESTAWSSGTTNEGYWIIVPEEDGYAPFKVSDTFITKHDPHPGGYYVSYADGYTSYSPAKAFEDGYTRI